MYCERQWYKSIMINVSGTVSPFIETFIMFKTDRIGRKTTLLLMFPLGLIGVFFGLAFNNLVTLTIFMVLSSVYYSVVFTVNFIYFNEVTINPIRSKATGIKSLSLSFGNIGKKNLLV